MQIPFARDTLVRITFLLLSISGIVSKSLSSSTELSVSLPQGGLRSRFDNSWPPLELDSSESENCGTKVGCFVYFYVSHVHNIIVMLKVFLIRLEQWILVFLILPNNNKCKQARSTMSLQCLYCPYQIISS